MCDYAPNFLNNMMIVVQDFMSKGLNFTSLDVKIKMRERFPGEDIRQHYVGTGLREMFNSCKMPGYVTAQAFAPNGEDYLIYQPHKAHKVKVGFLRRVINFIREVFKMD